VLRNEISFERQYYFSGHNNVCFLNNYIKITRLSVLSASRAEEGVTCGTEFCSSLNVFVKFVPGYVFCP